MKIEKHIHWFFIMPALFWVLVFSIYPMAYSYGMAFFRWDFTNPNLRWFVGLGNFARIFSDWRFYSVALTTITFTALSVSVCMVLGLAMALLFHREFKGKNIAVSIMLVPMMISPIAAALMWKQMLSSEWGIINFFIKSLGFEPVSFLVNARAALVSLAIIDIWQFTPFVFLILLSGLSSLSTEVFSAAKIDGASRWQTFRHVTFPLLTPFFLIALLLRTVDAFRVYDIVYVTTTGGPGIATETFSLNIYKIAFKILDVGYAAAVSMIMSWIAIIAITIYVRILRKNAKLQG